MPRPIFSRALLRGPLRTQSGRGAPAWEPEVRTASCHHRPAHARLRVEGGTGL